MQSRRKLTTVSINRSKAGIKAMRLASRSKSLSRTIPALQNRSRFSEKKSIDLPLTTQAISTTATFDLLNPVQEGASFNNRVGRKIVMRSAHWTGQVVKNAVAAGTTAEYLRLILLYDRQPNGVAPVLADVLQDVDGAGGITNNSQSGININNVERFAILRDTRITIPAQASAGVASNPGPQAVIDYTTNKVNINEFIKLKNLETHYSGTANPVTIANIATGSLYLMTVGSQAVATANFSVNYKNRIRFYDH